MPVDIQRIEMDQLACWRVRRGEDELLIAEQGAQILSYRQGDAPPIIWLSEEAAFQQGQSVRGGVPICWPWFGDLARNPQAVQGSYHDEQPAPFHGLVRALPWQLREQRSEGDTAILEFHCPQALGELPGWPQRVELTLQIRLADGLELSLDSRNVGDESVAISQALHSYFAVSDIHQVRVEGLTGCPYIDTLLDWKECQQQDDLHFSGETDRVYQQLPAILDLVDPAWQRRIRLTTSGSTSAVLWNPWVDKAQRLSSFADDAWQRMLCIETANVLADAVVLQPGQRHTLTVSISATSNDL
ncbi:D-hexose-6-phosphate mutarotase [Pseudomonas stutzeri]|jgi:glucose-6-phosphate 1-epimerase|uniref:Putative glucose-6-phosphate 1-epimerase n=1 Tax=Stutzerimonas stutzeri NF13 TaxID=1212548 RepID=M2TMP6_STUST|nr:D-hexose-6-phosphate mutarotase [Stutzerimonas stutzeri]EMD98570.1 aldose 1-epimerase [Stutzerimonas stutzeri NF13]MBK3879381.1 D-hexose-6-phosphate mutarotase [Stutzerimonas stutzeri]MCQ4291116.1 D-hexose-6-phosphate mutarotase [Stutzerimonas stutzeri]WOF77287.1 D-hexose-6-phosphate mutarotase [Pseudomonas sp. FeN3W]